MSNSDWWVTSCWAYIGLTALTWLAFMIRIGKRHHVILEDMSTREDLWLR